MLGGVEIASEKGLDGHSDADALIHAVIDALLGAAAAGDIGTLFPDTAAEWKDASSVAMLEKVAGIVGSKGFSVGNIDATIVCQAPRIAPYAQSIRENLARILSIGVDDVFVKGKTNEKMDATGAGEGLAVWAVCLLKSQQKPRSNHE